ncbi:MAG TPA: ATP-binding protein [Tepidisphaeraceae bacterium]
MTDVMTRGDGPSIQVSGGSSFSAFLSAVDEPRIVLAALTRLRWMAVIGQLGATGLAILLLRLRLPVIPIAAVVLVTAISNVLLMYLPALAKPPGWLVQAVLLFDIFLLTVLLYLTGGPENPFASLYVIHVAMAVIVLPEVWTWIVVAAVAVCYGALLVFHRPLEPALPPWIPAAGGWASLVLVSVLLAAFIGRVIRSVRQHEHELAAIRERAARSEQLAALTTLAAGAAHELNTPLGTIAVVAKELELNRDPAGKLDEVLEDARLIRREVDRCQTILSRMRIDIGEDVSHRSIVSLDELESHLREDIGEESLPRIKIIRLPEVESVQAPPRALEQALLVLLRNGLDASPPDWPVTLEVARNNGRVRFVVRDRGGGMSEEMIRRAGEPFYTTKEPGRGMGLGLFLVRLVAQQCGATFTIDSKIGVGTTCMLELSDPGAKNGAGRW